jgi:hypothetical protein
LILVAFKGRTSFTVAAELADPMRSEIVKGWLLSNLRAPE